MNREVFDEAMDSLAILMGDVAAFRRRHPGFVWPFTAAWSERRALRRRLRRLSRRSSRIFRLADEVGEHRRRETIG
jgi:hypothetical protein